MSDFGLTSQPSQFSRTLRTCRELYLSSGERCVLEVPNLLAEFPDLAGDETPFVQLMDDLHRALVLKIYVTLVEADGDWSEREEFLAEVLCHHLWSQWLDGDALRETILRAARESRELSWYSLVRPFDQIALLRPRMAELETIVMRLANLVARADGRLRPREAAVIKSIQDDLHSQLRSVPIDQEDQQATVDVLGAEAIESLREVAEQVREASEKSVTVRPAAEPTEPEAPAVAAESRVARRRRIVARKEIEQEEEQATPEEAAPAPTLEEALAELDRLIGLSRIKDEVHTLVNFLKMQRRRIDADLPATDVSLHMVFNGNPGTGKTTVARIVGKIYRAMGILEKGHLVETDRSGLVAEYAGQTGPKTNAKVDEAIGGVLFIDEAYSLIAARGEDAFGREAVQALLKRVEDDRERLVAILAGYPDEMETLLRSNPGLSSRFGRQLVFDDYTPDELMGIFGLFCEKNEYEISDATRAKIMQGLAWWYDHRDRHFGNGRAVRNLFEQAIRRMANRLADVEEITPAQLTRLEPEDIEFKDVPEEVFAEAVDAGAKETGEQTEDC